MKQLQDFLPFSPADTGGGYAAAGDSSGAEGLSGGSEASDVEMPADVSDGIVGFTSASVDQVLTALLAEDLGGNFDGATAHSDFAIAQDYDGHVALALDTGFLPNIDAALDLLTSSADLFDVPALDFGGTSDDALPS